VLHDHIEQRIRFSRGPSEFGVTPT
jgi:hypothetical protein